jgi:hypothetical protein
VLREIEIELDNSFQILTKNAAVVKETSSALNLRLKSNVNYGYKR